MTARELFHEIMFYGTFDRMPVVHWRGWPETRERWYNEGMPRNADDHAYFGTVSFRAKLGVHMGFYPPFEEEVLEETGEYRVFRDGDGVIKKDWKNKSCIPHFIDYTLKTARDWVDIKKRLQPDPGRIPADLDDRIERAKRSGLPISVQTASMMGWIRNWMGVQNMTYLIYESPDAYADMVDTISDLVCWALDIILPRVEVDMGFGWEDICCRSGPLVSPDVFDAHVAPGYRKIRRKLDRYGVSLYGLDSDGDITALVGRWLDAGVNLQLPVEVGPFKGDAPALRRKYGRELRFVGNFDKLTLEQSRDAVLAEIDRLMPLMREGGFIIMPDHLITPGVSLEMYRWYLDQIRNLRL